LFHQKIKLVFHIAPFSPTASRPPSLSISWFIWNLFAFKISVFKFAIRKNYSCARLTQQIVFLLSSTHIVLIIFQINSGFLLSRATFANKKSFQREICFVSQTFSVRHYITLFAIPKLKKSAKLYWKCLILQ
jgi:hypothetical protein